MRILDVQAHEVRAGAGRARGQAIRSVRPGPDGAEGEPRAAGAPDFEDDDAGGDALDAALVDAQLDVGREPPSRTAAATTWKIRATGRWRVGAP